MISLFVVVVAFFIFAVAVSIIILKISIDETSLSQGELYLIVTNKSGKGHKGSLIAMVKGPDVETVCAVLIRLSRRIRWEVREITYKLFIINKLRAKIFTQSRKNYYFR